MHFPIPLSHDTLECAMRHGIHPADIAERFTRGSGHGGQKINKTSNCVELTHIPSGSTVRVQRHREQHRNRSEAYRILIEKIAADAARHTQEAQQEAFRSTRRRGGRTAAGQRRTLREKRIRSERKRDRHVEMDADA